MALSQPYVGTLSVSATEQSLVSGTSVRQANSTAGVYQLFLDLSLLASGSSLRVRIREKVNGGAAAPAANGALTATAGGTLAAATYYVRSTWVTEDGRIFGLAPESAPDLT